jgi:putative acetyltransferase
VRPNVQIRTASPDDAEAIAEVLRAAFTPFESFYTPEAFTATILDTEKIRKRFEEKGVIWAALSDEKLVGTVSVVDEDERLYIRSMAVLPSAQGLGIGRKLLRTIENFGVQNGFEKLFLYSVPFLAGAIRLYEKNGFEHLGGGDPAEFFGTAWLAMEKTVERPGWEEK